MGNFLTRSGTINLERNCLLYVGTRNYAVSQSVSQCAVFVLRHLLSLEHTSGRRSPAVPLDSNLHAAVQTDQPLCVVSPSVQGEAIVTTRNSKQY